MNIMKTVKVAIIAALGFGLSACGMTTVDEGERGVWTEWGVATGTAEPGFHMYNPVSTDLVEFDVREQKAEGTTSADTADVQKTKLDYTLTYALDKKAIMATYKQAGPDWEAKYIDQNVQRAIKDVIGTKDAVADLVNKRSSVQDDIENSLRARLAKNRINLISFELRNAQFSKEFQDAIEEKQVAVEKANAAKNKTVEIEERARQRVITAKAEAEAIQIQSQALKGSPGYVELKRVEAWQKTGGKVPHTVITDGNAGVFLPSAK